MTATSIHLDFISDEAFRELLESDFREMVICAEHGVYKAVYVLAGSIVEAVLVDYLVGSGKNKPDPLKMSLSDLIAACEKAGVLTQKNAELSGALKSFRNLIHPGRTVRLGESADADGATIAQSLVSIIVRSVAAKKEKSYGLTAEQIVNKFENDPSAMGIADHLLSEAPAAEVERLLLKVLPERFFSEFGDDEQAPESDAHSQLFRAAFAKASDAVKRKVMTKYVSVLKQESGPRVQMYEEQFFRAFDLKYVRAADRSLVRDHLLSRMYEAPNVALCRAAEGIGTFVDAKTASKFIDPLVRMRVYRPADPKLGLAAQRVVDEESNRTDIKKADPAILSRLNDWESMFQARADDEKVAIVREIMAPFEAFELAPPLDDEDEDVEF